MADRIAWISPVRLIGSRPGCTNRGILADQKHPLPQVLNIAGAKQPPILTIGNAIGRRGNITD
ncbi:MAG TPA: hypothetical protein VHX39_32495, partial [Acetobacteraceae bacterium]|nr:hypothetical protein [Acetobacteraceae bacterium]